MPLNKSINIDLDEICTELDIDKEDLLFLMEQKNKNLPIEKANSNNKIKATEIINIFLNALNNKQIHNINSDITIKYYNSFLRRFNLYLNQEHKDIEFVNLNQQIFVDFLNFNCSQINATRKVSTLSQNTMNTYTSIMKRMIRFAIINEYISKDISYKFLKKGVFTLPKYFSTNQVLSILKEAQNRTYGFRWRAIFITLLGTGLRVRELSNLRVRDFDLKSKLIFTVGKGRKERYVPIYPQVERAVTHYLSLSGLTKWENNDGYLFSRDFGNERSRPVSVGSIQYTMSRIKETLNLDERFTVHSFRHTFAVDCLKANMRLEYLCQVLGHKDPKTTSIYTKLLPKDLQDEVNNKYPLPLEKLICEILGED